MQTQKQHKKEASKKNVAQAYQLQYISFTFHLQPSEKVCEIIMPKRKLSNLSLCPGSPKILR